MSMQASLCVENEGLLCGWESNNFGRMYDIYEETAKELDIQHLHEFANTEYSAEFGEIEQSIQNEDPPGDDYYGEYERRVNQVGPFFEASAVLSCVMAYLDYYRNLGKESIERAPVEYLVEDLQLLARVIEPLAEAGKRIRIVVN